MPRTALLAARSALPALAAVAVLTASPASPARAADFACEAARDRPDQFKVAIDRDSGIAFVHSPCGYTYMGVVARESIDHDIRMSHAEPVPAEVLRAEVARQPSLAKYLTGRKAQVARAGPVR